MGFRPILFTCIALLLVLHIYASYIKTLMYILLFWVFLTSLFRFLFTFIQILYQEIFFFPTKIYVYFGTIPFKALIFFFFKGPIRTARTVHGSQSREVRPWFAWALLFFHRVILEVKRTAKLRGLQFSRSGHTFWSGFQNHACLNKTPKS